ncbi:MAG: TetR family transcriptional regulator C-terminal domain-containing protein [Lachnospiraceae bacterium]|nr:TetR family transcriptional regulator C-terminal domain-containing protein [Lachnospiraceae bacterium]
MEKPQTDRRTRRTKALLLKGLMQLMETKDIKDISVKELSDLVDINRSTFYLHYSDIYDMLDQIENELFVEFNDILDRTICREFEPVSAQTALFEIFSFLERHRDVAKTIIGPHGDLSFVNRMRDLVKERIHNLLDSNQPRGDYAYIEAFVVSGCVGVIETWLGHPDPRSPEEISMMCSTLLTKGSFLC